MSQAEDIREQRSSIKIILAEDHHVVRNGIRSLLERQPDFSLVAEAGNGNEVLQSLSDGLPADIILTDINMPDMDGIEMIEAVRAAGHKPRIIVLSMLDNEKFVVKAFNAGANGYLLKNVTPVELIFAIRHVVSGGEYVCAEVAMRLLKRVAKVPQLPPTADLPELNLSERDTEVLELIAEGYTNQEIADRLFSSKRTIEGYRHSLMNRTGSRNTAALIKFALRNSIID